MLERLRQNMRDMNRTVKWVWKKQISYKRDQGRGQLWKVRWYVWEIDGEAETTGIQSQTWKWVNWRKGKFIIWKCLGAEKSLARDGTVRRLVGQVDSELERWWQEIRMERTGWRCEFEIYSRCRGKLPKALSQDVVWDCSYIKKIIIMIWPLAGEKFKG